MTREIKEKEIRVSGANVNSAVASIRRPYILSSYDKIIAGTGKLTAFARAWGGCRPLLQIWRELQIAIHITSVYDIIDISKSIVSCVAVDRGQHSLAGFGFTCMAEYDDTWRGSTTHQALTQYCPSWYVLRVWHRAFCDALEPACKMNRGIL